MKTEQLVIALGVVSALSDEVYDPAETEQSGSWDSLRKAMFILSRKIEQRAKEEVRGAT
jgi:hypothetical protein